MRQVLWVLLSMSGMAAADAVELRPLSSRPDMVSGGSVLVEVVGQASAFSLNGRAVPVELHRRGGAQIALISGLTNGKNSLEMQAGKLRVRLELVNYPSAGPIFSGPHQTPFVCETEAAGLGPALDANCSAATVVDYFYKSTDSGLKSDGVPAAGFKAFAPSQPRPADIAQTTNTLGKTVDYVVRRERGTINRALYELAILADANPLVPQPWAPPPGWNGRLIYTFGGGCGAGFRQARSPGVLNDEMLAKGYAVAASSLNVLGNNCNDVLSAETAMMVKEHFVKQFGVPVHTLGWGGSGGSMQQHLIAQNYPGILDGILPGASYPDTLSITPGSLDCSLLNRAFDTSSQTWTEEQKTAVAGFATWGTCGSILRAFSPQLLDPKHCNASVKPLLIYDPVSNPGGARCDLYDNQVNLLGRDPKTGFAARPLDNVGVQYGLVAFNAGKINFAQFLDLNRRVGGYDVDGRLVADRTVGNDAAVRRLYQMGRVNSGGGSLGAIPIIDMRTYADLRGDIHDRFRSLSTRERLTRANGSSANQVILTYAVSMTPPQMAGVIASMDQWLDNIAKDSSKGSAAEKVVRNKPRGLHDACWTETGEEVAGLCATQFPIHGDPRVAAGGPLMNDVIKCTLKPVSAKDYKQSLTAEQAAELKNLFREGICDYSRPGIGQQPLQQTWMHY